MKLAVALLLTVVPTFIVVRSRLFDPEAAAIDRAFERADRVLRAQASRKGFDRIPDGDWAFARLLPVGHWKLLVEAYPDRAFERYSARLDHGFPDGLVAAWGIHALAQLRHPPVRTLLLGRLGSADPETQRHAVRLLGSFMDPRLAPRLLAMLPESSEDYDRNELSLALLSTVTAARFPDLARVRAALERYERGQDPRWTLTDTPRLRLEFLGAADPARAAERLLLEDPRDLIRDDFEEWLPAYAAKEGLVSLAPALRRRVERELEAEKDRPKFLDPAGSGEPLDPQFDAFWGFRGAFVLAAYRKALRDLGVPLTDEERGWLDRHRLLRPAREYLVEAGVLPK